MLEIGLPRLERTLATLHGSALELDRTELLTAAPEVFLGSREGRLAVGESDEEVGELSFTCLEIRRPEPQHSLDRGTRVAKQLLPALELGDRLAEACGVGVELRAALREQLLEPLLRVRARVQDATDEAGLGFVVLVLVGARHLRLTLVGLPTDRS